MLYCTNMTMLAASLLITESAYLARQLWEHSCRRSFPLGWYGLIVGQSEGLHTNNIPQQYNASLFDYREKLKINFLVVGQLINICCLCLILCCQAQPIVSSSWLRLASSPAFPHQPTDPATHPGKSCLAIQSAVVQQLAYWG